MLANFLRSRRKQKLIDEVQKNPQPPAEVFIELVQLLHEDGDIQGAANAAKRAAELYPDSERVLQSQSEMLRFTRDLEKERYRQKIVSYPNPILYVHLARLYRDDNETDAAIQVCQAGIANFPSDGGCYSLLGEICSDGGDLAGARAHLEKAVDLDRYNYAALKLLADVYAELGKPDKAARRLEDILYFAPGDETIMERLREVREVEGNPPPGEEDATAEIVESADEEPVAAVIHADAEEEEDAGGAGKAPRQVQGEQDLIEAIGTITEVKGVGGALLVDPYGLTIAADLKDDIDEDLAGAMITNIYRAVARSAEPMGIGTFEDGLIEGEAGNIHILGIEDMILAVFASPRVKLGMLEKTIRNFADRILD